MSYLSFLRAGALAPLACCGACGSSDPTSICGSERPCVPEGTWVMSYEMTPTGQGFSSNTIRVAADGSAEVVGAEAPDNACPPDATGPGAVNTNAELLNDGCTLTAEISKSWCQSGEANCERRSIALDFCNNGSATVASGSLDACVCWVNGSPFCDAVDNTVSVAASAARSSP